MGGYIVTAIAVYKLAVIVRDIRHSRKVKRNFKQAVKRSKE